MDILTDNKYKVILGDAITGMREIDSNTIDCIITDPPYPTIAGGSGGADSTSEALRPSGMLAKNDGKIFSYNAIEIENWIGECYRILKEDTHIYVMTNFLNLEKYMKAIREAGFILHNLLIWEKNNATPNRWYMKNCEYIIFARKGMAKPINNCGSKTVLQYKNVTNKIHPTEKPIELLQTLVTNSTTINDIVFDPFGGSFSTVVAALLTNRRCISYEIDENYYTVGKQRLDSIDLDNIKAIEDIVKPLTTNQQIIIDYLKQHPNEAFTGKQLAEGTGLSARTCSGCFTPLITAKLIRKTNSSSPYMVRIVKIE